MPWFRLDDGFHCHPKVLKAGNAAVGLYVRCGAYAAQQLTDGFIPEHIVDLYGDETLAESLVRSKLWRRARGGWRMPDYLTYNPSRDQVEAEREKNRERQRESRKRRSGAMPSRRDNGVTHGSVTGAPAPPVPYPLKGDARERASPRCPQHIHNPNPPPCGQCADARRATETAQAEKRQRENDAPKCPKHRGLPAENCGLCRSEQVGADPERKERKAS